MAKKNNVLVIRLSAFGDVAMLVPVIYSVADKYKDVTFFVLTREGFAALFDGLLPNIVPIPVNVDNYKGVRGLHRLGRELMQYRIGAVADVHDLLRSRYLRIFFALKGCRVRYIKKGKTEKRAIVQHKCKIHQLKTSIERYLDVFDALGYPAEIHFTSYQELNFFGEEKGKKNINGGKSVDIDEISNVGDSPISGTKIELPESVSAVLSANNIGIASFAKHPVKTYPLDKMEQVIKKLSAVEGRAIFLFGSKQEKEVLEEWQQKYKNVLSVAGALTLKQELLLMSKLQVMLSMDSANMHLASLVAVPVVSVWGGTHPCFGFYGFNQAPENAVQVSLSCRPCSVFGNTVCKRGNLACLDRITPASIVDKIEKFLK